MRESADVWNTALADPLAFERAEAERLVDIVRQNAGDDYLGEARPEPLAYGMGWYHGLGWFNFFGDLPDDLVAVNQLCACLRAIESGETEQARLLKAKRLWWLLERAQRACGIEPLSETAARLTPRQREVILALNKYRAFERADGINVPKILEGMPDGADVDHVKDIVRQFVADGTLEADGERKHRKNWLSVRGRMLAEELHFMYGTPL